MKMPYPIICDPRPPARLRAVHMLMAIALAAVAAPAAWLVTWIICELHQL